MNLNKTLIFFLSINLFNSQDYSGRVGINTSTPNASLEIYKHNTLPVTSPQGVIFPKFTTDERNKFTIDPQKQEGLMIYNITKKCLEMSKLCYFKV